MSDPIVAVSADGIEHEFPAETPRPIIDAAMKKYALSKAPSGTPPISAATEAQLAKSMPLTASDYLKAGPEATQRGAMRPTAMQELRASPIGELGYGIEHSAGGLAQGAAHLFGNSQTAANIDESMAQDRRAQDLSYRMTGRDLPPLIPGLQHPGETGGQMIAAAPLAAASGPALALAAKVSPYLAGGLAGAEFGAAAPVDSGPEGYKRQKLAQVLGGAATGVVLPASVNAISSGSPPAAKIMTTDELQKAGSAEFQKFSGTPVPVTSDFADAISGRYGKQAINDAIDGAESRRDHSLVTELKSLLTDDPKKLPQQVSAEAADKISRAFREAGARAMKSDEGTIGSGLFGRRNDVENTLSSVPGVADARQLWKQFEKSKVIDNAIETAQDLSRTPAGAGGLDQALRNEFGKIIRDRDLFATFTPEEQDAIVKVRQGTLGANVLQRLGKLSPAKNHLSALVELGAAIGGGLATGGVGVIPAAALAGTGLAANAGANALTSKSARLASELTRSGGTAIANASAITPAMLAARQQSASPMAIALARALSAQGAH